MTIAARAIQSASSNEDSRAAFLQESRLEAACDIAISRLQDELREAKRTGSPESVIDAHQTSIEAVCTRRERHRCNILDLKRTSP